MPNYATEFLIMHEAEIDWEALSKNASRSFSLAEIRMFRKRINWIEYMKNHVMSPEGMEIASKHFTKEEYNFIALLNLADNDFIEKHQDKFNWELVLQNCSVSPETLTNCFSCWKNIDKEQLRKLLTGNNLIDIYDGRYDDVLLYLDIKN